MGEHILRGAHPVHSGDPGAAVPARGAAAAVRGAASPHTHVYQPGESSSSA